VNLLALKEQSRRVNCLKPSIEILGARAKKVPLAVVEKDAEVVGDTTVSLEIAKCPMPRRETIEVIKGLREEAIVGLDIIEKYDLVLDTKAGRIRLKKCPPEVVLI